MDDALMHDVYACYDDATLQRAVQLLQDQGLEPLVRHHESHAFPTNVGTTAERVVAVRPEQVSTAQRILKEATDDGVIGDGTFMS